MLPKTFYYLNGELVRELFVQASQDKNLRPYINNIQSTYYDSEELERLMLNEIVQYLDDNDFLINGNRYLLLFESCFDELKSGTKSKEIKSEFSTPETPPQAHLSRAPVLNSIIGYNTGVFNPISCLLGEVGVINL